MSTYNVIAPASASDDLRRAIDDLNRALALIAARLDKIEKRLTTAGIP